MTAPGIGWLRNCFGHTVGERRDLEVLCFASQSLQPTEKAMENNGWQLCSPPFSIPSRLPRCTYRDLLPSVTIIQPKIWKIG